MDKVKAYPDIYKLSRAAAEFFVSQSQFAIRDKGRFTVAFSGGSTPETFYALLATEAYRVRVEWDKVYVFWSDERCVPPEHVDSNFRMARDALLDQVPIPSGNIFRIKGEDQPNKAASDYDRLLRDFFDLEDDTPPRIDLVLLGLGVDGHIASLFPNSDALEVTDAFAAATFIDEMRAWRVTLTLPVINAAHFVLFLVTGSNKARRVEQILANASPDEPIPAQRVAPVDGDLIWLLDDEAAANLDL
jgi:6-phosphogluconolactonase